MEQESGPEQLQALSHQQKINFLRKRFEHTEDKISQNGGIRVSLLHPEGLVSSLTGKEMGDMNFPPQMGRIIKFIYDRTPGHRRIGPVRILVDLTSTKHVSGVSFVPFNIDEIEVTKGGEIIIDCAKSQGVQASLI